MKAFYDHEPSRLEAVGDGSYRYRFNITVETTSENENQWQCDEVIVWNLSSNKITEAVINELWDNNHEQKLVNEYNAAQLGVYEGDVAELKVEAYVSFLNERNNIKIQVDADCEELGIR